MYDAQNQWSLSKDVEAVYLRWTITDTALSHDQRHLLYATIDSTVYVVRPYTP
jgi:WD repeat-containing protein 23